MDPYQARGTVRDGAFKQDKVLWDFTGNKKGAKAGGICWDRMSNKYDTEMFVGYFLTDGEMMFTQDKFIL